MRRLQLLFILFASFACYQSTAQIFAPNMFLQGRYLEIGMCPNAAFGACSSIPATYHPHNGGTTVTPGVPLAEVFDYGHDGWTVGSPSFMGDYTYPGSPFEGWELQIGTGRAQMFQDCGGFISTSGPFSWTSGALTTYSNAGGVVKGNWAGVTNTGLSVKQETRVDTNASWVVVTTKFYNTTGATIPNIYYMRSCDPDNDESWSGSFTTNNYIDYQQATDPDRRVQVRATTYDGGFGGAIPNDEYPLSLCTKDCRAVACIYNSWPLTVSQDLSAIWNQTYGPPGSGAYYNPTGHSPSPVVGDIGIALVYNLGSLCAGDSTFVSYAYTFLVTNPGDPENGISGIDSAFPEPNIVVNGVPGIPTSAAPGPIFDTFNACLFPGMTTLNVDLSSASTGVWTWSTWTWSPGTGLASTTGTTNTINLLTLPPSITYTITGTAFTNCGGTGTSCGARVIYLTVLTCNGATVNSPCVGDPLFFNAPGDSTGATYQWYGPNTFSSTPSGGTAQAFTVTPSHWSDTGTYWVVKTVAGTTDTATTVVHLHPKPNVTASSNSPLCIGALDTLRLFSTTDVAVTTYSWTGPASYTASVQNPTVPGFAIADTGIYTIVVTTPFGCKDTASTHVIELPPPVAPIVTDPNPYCFGAAFIPFTVTGVTGTVYWYPSASGGVGTTTAPVVNTTSPGTYTYYFGQTVGSCESPIDSITIVVYPKVTADFNFTYGLGCVQDTVFFVNASTGATSYSWNFGDGTSAVSDVDPVHIFSQPGAIQSVTLTATFASCNSTMTKHPDTRHSVQAVFVPFHDTICVGTSSTMVNSSTATFQGGAGTITNTLWNFGNGTTDITVNPAPVTYVEEGIYPVTLTVTDAIGCTSTDQHNVYVVGISVKSWHDTTLCLRQPLALYNTVIQTPDLGLSDYTYSWSPTNNLDSPNNHIPYFSGFGDFIYIETVNLILPWGAQCPTTNTMTIHSVLGKQLSHVTASSTILYGSSIQLNADSAIYYWWVPADGSLNNPNINNPVATPTETTVYTVYGMDIYGCVDSAFVTVHVDSDMHECIPTGFTPNGDGLNDIFRPVGIKFQNLVDFRVYNRWGQQVFYTANPEMGWDGTFNGVVQDMGTYFYTIIVGRPGGKGDNIIYKGDVTLIK